eukprot:GHVS01083670.1.p1 GENE.GHVS01083670.1~~GHVS01083670.1.p1  ORF type:complete len:497 (-),score=55.73 GHVS01083670.1:883-2373(-)
MSSSFKFEVQQAPCVSCTEKKHRIWGLVCILLVGQFTIPLNAQRSLSVWPTARGESSFPSHSSSAVGLPGLPVGLSSPPRALANELKEWTTCQISEIIEKDNAARVVRPALELSFQGTDFPKVVKNLFGFTKFHAEPENQQIWTPRNIIFGIGAVFGAMVIVGGLIRYATEYLVKCARPKKYLLISSVSNLAGVFGGFWGMFFTAESEVAPQIAYGMLTFVASLMMIWTVASYKRDDIKANMSEDEIVETKANCAPGESNPKTNTNNIRKRGNQDKSQGLTETPNSVEEKLPQPCDTLGSGERQDPIVNGGVVDVDQEKGEAAGEALPNSTFGGFQFCSESSSPAEESNQEKGEAAAQDQDTGEVSGTKDTNPPTSDEVVKKDESTPLAVRSIQESDSEIQVIKTSGPGGAPGDSGVKSPPGGLSHSKFGVVAVKRVDPNGNVDESHSKLGSTLGKSIDPIDNGDESHSKFRVVAVKSVDPIVNNAVGDSDQGSGD